MSSWRTFPDGGWSLIGRVLTGFGNGEGSYGAAYAIDTNIGPFLNGRVSAQMRLAGDRQINGAGVISRADDLRTFIAFYVLADDTGSNLYSVRLAAFKYGKLAMLVGLKEPILIPDRQFHIALQFFSGDMVGQVTIGAEAHTLRYLLPEGFFPGYCGPVRFYGSSATATNIHIEKIALKPILPEGGDDTKALTHPFRVFLSHSNADKAVVLKVIEVFQKSGIPYWVDHEQITFGDGIVARIEDALQKSKYVVVCLSKNLATSGWCRAEYGPILYREFSGDTSRRVIPLSLDGSRGSDDIPLLLSDKMRADFTDQKSFAAFIRFLRESGSK